MKRGWLIALVVCLALAIFIIVNMFVSFDRPEPIPKDKEAFIGLWRTQTGFQLEIDPSGIANVIQIFDRQNPDYAKLDIGITPEYAKGMLVEFKDDVLWLTAPKVRAKSYLIDRNPYMDGNTWSMVLNGVLFTKQ
jgi:hypothetical protein